MSDIVERLKNRLALRLWADDRALLKEASEEIERLRATLVEIQYKYDMEPHHVEMIDEALRPYYEGVLCSS